MQVMKYSVQPKLTHEQTKALEGEFVDDSYYDLLIQDDADVFKEDGTPLLHFRKRQIPQRHAAPALKALIEAATDYGNRGIAAGKLKYHNIQENAKKRGQIPVNIDPEGTRITYMREDGTLSKRAGAIYVPSGIIGGYDRNPSYPYCRLTKFTADNPGKIQTAMPYIKAVNEVFKNCAPSKYNTQLAECNRTHTDYVFKDTVFTTITVNRNWRTAVHTDAGDLKAGFGVLSVLTEGRYNGGYLVIPRYGVAVDMRHADVLLMDVHEFHGNTEMIPVSKYWTRLSTVYYFRTKLVGCKSLKDEIEVAKRRVAGQPMYADFEGEFPE